MAYNQPRNIVHHNNERKWKENAPKIDDKSRTQVTDDFYEENLLKKSTPIPDSIVHFAERQQYDILV